MLLIERSTGCSGSCKLRANNGKCDEMCNSADCRYDGGECLKCTACPLASLGNGQCDLACDVEECLFDLGDCNGLCSRGCLSSMIGNGKCDEACNNLACGYDGDECGCTQSLLSNGVCDSHCQKAAYLFDAQDCAEFIYVNASLPALSGTGSRTDPYRSWSLALSHPFQTAWAGVCFLQGQHFLEQVGPAKLWFDANVTHLFLTCRFCPDCEGGATLFLVDGMQAFLQANLTAAIVEDLHISGLQRFMRGCTGHTCAFCEVWSCNNTTCTNTRNQTVPLASVPLFCLELKCFKPTTAVLLLNQTAELVLKNLAFSFLYDVFSVLDASSASVQVENILVTDVDVGAFAVQLSGISTNRAYYYTYSSSGTGQVTVSAFQGLMNLTLANLTVQRVNTERSTRGFYCLNKKGEVGALKIFAFHEAQVSSIRVSHVFNFAASSSNCSAIVSIEAVEHAVVRDCKLSVVQSKGGGLDFAFFPLLMVRPEILNIDVANVLVEDSLFIRGGAFQITSPELNPLALVVNITVRRSAGQAFVLSQDPLAVECANFAIASLFASVAPRYLTVQSIEVTESNVRSFPLFQLLNVCNCRVTDVNLERTGVAASAVQLTSLGLYLGFSFGTEELLQNFTTELIGVEQALNLSIAQLVLRDSHSTGSLAICHNSSQVTVSSSQFRNNSAATSGLLFSDAIGVLDTLLFVENQVQIGIFSSFRSNISLRNSHFLSNQAERAAGVFLDSAEAVLSSLLIERNRAQSGAALVLSTSWGKVSLLLEASAFRYNEAAEGRELLVTDTEGVGVQLLMLNSTFEGGSTASLLWLQPGSRLLSAHLRDLSFQEASSADFKGLFTLQFSAGELIMERCLWLQCSNHDRVTGSIIYVDTSSEATVSFKSCVFEANTAAFLVSLPNEYQVQTLQVIDSRFTANDAQLFDLINALVQVQHSLFQGNSQQGALLARALFGSTLRMTNCLVLSNGPSEELLLSGERSVLELSNCTFSENTSSWALVSASNSRLQLVSSEFTSNLVLRGSLLQLQTSTLLAHLLHVQTNSPMADLLMCTATLLTVTAQQSAGLLLRESQIELQDIWLKDCLGPCLQATKTTIIVQGLTAEGWQQTFVLTSSNLTARDLRVSQSHNWLLLQSSEADLQRVFVDHLAGPAEMKNSKVSLLDSVCHSSYGCFTGQNSSFYLNKVSMQNNSASALVLSDSHFSAEHTVWSGNQADEGAGLHAVCLCGCCVYQLSDSLFEDNAAVRGAAIYYEGVQPGLRNVSFRGNKAAYGSELGTVAQRLVNISEWPEGVSGQPYALPRLQLEDELGRIMTADNESGLLITAPVETILKGGSRAIAENGVFSFNGLRLTTRPNSTIQITAAASKVPVVTFDVYFRPCIAGEVVESESCVRCEPMTYSLNPSDRGCEQCPDGAVCYGGAEVFPMPGYWRSSNLSDTFYPCSRACLGSPTRSQPTGECEEGYRSNLCSACSIDYFRFAGTSCRKCPNTSVNVVLSLLLCLAYLCFLAKIVSGSISRAKKSETSLHLKLLLNYMQVTMLLGEFSLQWPDLLLQVFYTSSLAGNSSQSLLALDCFVPDVYAKHLVVGVVPLVQIAMSFLFWGAVALLRGHRRYVCDHNLSTIMSLLLLMHSALASSVLSLFACRRLDNGIWLLEDISLRCWEDRHLFTVLVLGLPSLLIWVLGFPLVFVVLLRGAPRETPVTKLRYGFFYSGYKDHFFFWEALVIFRKVTVKAVSVVLSHSEPIQRVMAANTVIVLMLALQLNFQPYESLRINRIETLSMAANFLTLTLGAFFNSQNSQAVQNLLFTSIVSANCAFLIYWGRSLILTSAWCTRRRHKRVQAQTTDLDQSISPCQPPREIDGKMP